VKDALHPGQDAVDQSRVPMRRAMGLTAEVADITWSCMFPFWRSQMVAAP
jgi:hypothetical protein